MKVQLFISTIVLMAAIAPSAKADTYMETEVSRPLPLESREIRTTIERTPVIQEEVVRPTIVTPPANNETIVVKKHSHHLLNLGVVKVF
jgi:hypothetical protein